MAILNYTTTIDLHKTALEVQRMLAIKGAQALPHPNCRPVNPDLPCLDKRGQNQPSVTG